MTAQFILSLDCEGKWGVADRLTRRHHESLSDRRLRDAYEQIVQLLEERDIPATFAFVGLFGEADGSFRQLLPLIRQLRDRAPSYLEPALTDLREGSREGWHGSWAVDMVGAARTPHEIALHGVTHVPWSSEDESFFEREMDLFRELSSPVAGSKTFIFPRNRVDHVDVLARSGFSAYRGLTRQRSQFESFASEFKLWAQPETPRDCADDAIVEIPGGYFVNLRRGLRRLVPREVTRQRFRMLLDRAVDGRVVHAWLHPENVATVPETLDLVRDLLELVVERRESGTCKVLTQLSYAGSVGRAVPAIQADLKSPLVGSVQ